MGLKEPVKRLLNKIYEPNSMIEGLFKSYYAAFKTDEEGRLVLLFPGKKGNEGRVKGERFARRLKIDRDGKVIKDHWEHKGKAT